MPELWLRFAPMISARIVCGQDAEGDVTQEQMEAYMQSKPRWDDPMNQMKDTT